MGLNANFSALPLSGPAPLEVQFTDESIVDGGSVITDRLWTFDDGDTSTDLNPLHEYDLPGLYSPSLKIIHNGLAFQITTAPTLSWDNVIFAGGLFVALASDTGVANVIMTSPDGIVWTQRTTPSLGGSVSMTSLAYNGSEFIVFGQSNVNQSLYSADGITWAQRTLDDWLSAKNVAYGNGIYVMMRGGIQYSYNGINWAGNYIAPMTLITENVDFVNGKFLVTGQYSGGLAKEYIGVSTNGTSWVYNLLPLTSLGRVAYGNGVYVLTRGRNPGSDDVMVSSDLITWNIYPVGLGSMLWNDIIFDNGLFIMTANDVSGVKAASSPDGINWTGLTIVGGAVGKIWRGIAGNGSGLYAMVNQNGDAAYSTIAELETDTELKTDYIDVINSILYLRRREAIDDGL